MAHLIRPAAPVLILAMVLIFAIGGGLDMVGQTLANLVVSCL